MNYAVIMAGGSGQRLWPLSRKLRPKQIIDTFNGQSLLQHCYDRIKDIFPPDKVLVVTNREYADSIAEHMPQIPYDNILGEPVGRDTANAIGLAAVVLNQVDPTASMAVFSADQLIEPVEVFHRAVQESLAFVESRRQVIVTLGIKATSAHTGYGYLKRGVCLTEHPGICKVEEFREKPSKSAARNYLRSGDYCWNSGIFFWKVDTILNLLDRFLPASCERLRFIGDHWNTPERYSLLDEQFPKLQKISIDYAILEHAEEVYMVEMDTQWQDLGSYEAIVEHFGMPDHENNISTEKTLCHWMQAHNNIAISTDPKHLVAAVSVENLIVVHTPDATLVCHRDDTSHLKKMLEQMEQRGMEDYI